MNGGNRNARIVENTVAAYPVGVGYCYWSMPFLLYLFGGDVVRTVEYSVPALAALLVGHMQTGVWGLIGAFLISPFGFPKAASWMIDRIDDLRAAVTAI